MSNPVIEVTHLCKTYGDIVAVKDVSFTVEANSIFALVGPNGAGKTTTVETIEGLRRPDSGAVKVLGLDPLQERRAIFRQVGVQLQENSLHPRQKVGEALEVFASFHKHPANVGELLEKCGLEGRSDDFYGKLSGGQKRRLLLVLALIGAPKLVILDEPTSGLDPQARYNIWKLLKELRANGTTIFLTTHYLDEAEKHCDMLCVMDHGTVIALGQPKNLLREYNLETCMRLPLHPALSQQVLQTLPNISKVEQLEDQYVLYGSGSDLLRQTTNWLDSHGVPTNTIESRRASLDDLYLLMTGREYRKE